MKSKYILFGALAVVAVGATVVQFSSKFGGKTQESYQPRTEKSKILFGHAKSAAGAFEYYTMLKGNINTGKIEIADLINSQQQVAAFASQKGANGASDMKWDAMGPDNQGGRTYAILFEKSNPNNLFAGAISGGLWKSTTGGTSWSPVAEFANNNISCIHQAANGTIYFGTGEDISNSDGSGNSGFMGQGMWKSTDKGATWEHMESTIPTNINNANLDFSFISEITTMPANSDIIYAATNRGVRKSEDGGLTWTNPLAPLVGTSYNVDVTTDGVVVCDISGRVYISYDGVTFENQSIKSGLTNPNKLPSTGIGRMSIDCAKSDANYIYVLCSSPAGGAGFEGVYRTINKGVDWELYIPGRVSGLNIFTQDPNTANAPSHQGWYDIILAVHPTNKDKIYCGGIDLWAFSPTTSFERISMWFGESTETNVNPYYVHADQHAIAFHPTNPDIILFGNDGGVFKSINGGLTFNEVNKGYITTQFYTACFGPTGEVMGGLQDNGTQYIDFQGNTLKAAREVRGGDGFDCEMSWLNPNAFFSTTYQGAVGRSPGKGNSFSAFYSLRAGNDLEGDAAAFHTKIRMWESKTLENTLDSVYFTTPTAISAGTVINQVSKTASTPISWVADKDFAAGAKVGVPDPVRSRLVVAGQIGGISVWMTDEHLNFSTSPRWFKVAKSAAIPATPGFGANDPLSAGSPVNCFAFSTDGDYLYLGQTNGNVYRISNLNTIKNMKITDTLTGEIGHANSKLWLKKIGNLGRIVTSLAVDPKDPNTLVATLGGYGSVSSYVYKCSAATTAPTSSSASNFSAIQGDLPLMPVYSSVIDYQNPEVIVLGTEYGIFASEDGGGSWTARNSGMGKIPVFSLRQQALPYNECWNTGMLYAGTHGKGIFKSDALVSIKDNATKNNTSRTDLNVYPNPVVESATINFSLEKNRNISVVVYDMSGRAVKSFDLDKKPEGNHQFTFSSEELNAGTYMVAVNGGDDYKKISKFVVVR